MTTEKRYPYKIEIDWSADEQIYFARVWELPGLLTHGDTYKEALEKAVELIPIYHEMMREDGEYLKALEDALKFYANPKQRMGLMKTDMGAVARETLSKKR